MKEKTTAFTKLLVSYRHIDNSSRFSRLSSMWLYKTNSFVKTVVFPFVIKLAPSN